MLRSLAIFLGILLILCVAQAMYLYAADPWRIFDWPEDESVEDLDLFYHLRFQKPLRMRQLKPEYLILGTSRAARLPPFSNGQRVTSASYNAAIPGATLFELRSLLEHGIALGNLNSLTLALDQSMYRPVLPPYRLGFSEYRQLSVARSLFGRLEELAQATRDYWHALLSRNSLWLATAPGSQSNFSPRAFYADGTWFGSRYEERRKFNSAMVRKNERQRQQDMRGYPNWDELETILALTREHSIKLEVVLTPLHASVLKEIADSGHWERYEADQRAVVALINAFDPKVSVWGLENIPDLVADPAMKARWYEDGLHLNAAGGRAVVDCIAELQCPLSVRPIKLTPASLAGYQGAVRDLLSGNRPKRPGVAPG